MAVGVLARRVILIISALATRRHPSRQPQPWGVQSCISRKPAVVLPALARGVVALAAIGETPAACVRRLQAAAGSGAGSGAGSAGTGAVCVARAPTPAAMAEAVVAAARAALAADVNTDDDDDVRLTTD